MNKRVLWIFLGVIAVFAVLAAGAAAGSALTFLFLRARPVEAAASIVLGQGQAVQEPGVLVTAVEADSPASKAGLVRGDIILRMNDQTVNQARELVKAIGGMQPGDEVTIHFRHGDEERTSSATLGERNGSAYLGVVPCMDVFMFGKEGVFPVEIHPFASGAVISEVVAGSPAEEAGLKPGDVITSVGDAALGEDMDLAKAIAAHQPGEEVELAVQHSGETESHPVQVTLGEHPENAGEAYLGVRYWMALKAIKPDGGDGNLPKIPRFYQQPFEPRSIVPGFPDLPEGVTAGAVIRHIAADSPAAEAGLKAGDVIVDVDGTGVKSPVELVDRIQAKKPGDTVSLGIYRAGESERMTVQARLGEHPDTAGRAYLGVELGGIFRFERVIPREGDT